MFDETRNEQHKKWLNNSSSRFVQNQKIVLIDPHRSHSRFRCDGATMSDCGDNLHHFYEANASSLPYQIPSRISVHECQHSQDSEWCFHNNVNDRKLYTAHSTPRLSNSSQANTPVKNVSGDALFSPYSNFPNYMANTHASKARVRSLSAPKQRPEIKKRVPLDEIMAARNSISCVRRHC